MSRGPQRLVSQPPRPSTQIRQLMDGIEYPAASTVDRAPRPAEVRAATGAAQRVLVQPGRNAFPDMTAFLVERFGFELVQLTDYDGHLAQSKWTHLRGLARQSVELLKVLPRLRRSDCVVTLGPVTHGHLLRLLRRLRIVRYRRSIAIGWYFHSPSWFPLLRWLAKLDGPNDYYVLFSDWEIELYRVQLGIDPKRMHWLPYGEWGVAPQTDGIAPPGGLTAGQYYFAGGFSNRDYPSLIEAFRTIAAPLVIVGSAVDTDLTAADLPANVTVLCDLPPARFEAYLTHAKACIIPLKRDTGASGQSVTLRAMRNGKPIIASDVGSMRDYIVEGVSGFLVRDMAQQLPALVTRIERDPEVAGRLGKAAYRRYCERFSPAAGNAALSRLLAPLVRGDDNDPVTGYRS
jgi:glycosyltransferase involved in cell wall biosynthesis